jgi:hypothetical protein
LPHVQHNANPNNPKDGRLIPIILHRASDWYRLKKPYLAGMLLRKNQ